MSQDMPGRQIGHIRIETAIGRGGMGQVYRGWDEKLQRRVALKTIRGQHRLDQATRGRFMREARILSKLDHPGICRIYDLIEYPDCDFLVLEYIDGLTLTRLIRDHHPPPERTLEIAEQIARILAVAHAEGVAHRDLKPDNVMVTHDGQVKILDFGLSRTRLAGEPSGITPRAGSDPAVEAARTIRDQEDALDTLAIPSSDSGTLEADLTEEGSVIGTLRYMSPEQARSEPASEASDLFSLGILLHELFTGRHPYPADINPGKLLLDIQRGALPPLTGLDPVLAALVSRLTNMAPDRRPSAAEAADALAAIRQRPRLRRQRRLRITLWVTAAMLLLLAVLCTWWLSRRPAFPEFQPGERIAILPIADRTGRVPWVRTGLRELVVRSLEKLPEAVLVPLDQIEEAMPARILERSDALGPAEVAALQKVVGAHAAVESWIENEQDEYRLTYRISVAGRQVHRQLRGVSLPVLGERFGLMLAEELQLGSLKVQSHDPFASQAYGTGVHLLRTRGAKAARPLFEASLVVDPDLSWSLLRLAQCEEQSGRWDEAVRQARRALQAAEAHQDQSLAAAALTILGGLASARADYPAANGYLQQALKLASERGDKAGQATALFQLGQLAFNRGDWVPARERFLQALELERKSGDHPGETDSINYLGLIELNTRNYAEAERLLRQARSLAEGYGDRRRRALASVNLGSIAQRREQPEAAEALWRESLADLRACGDRRNELIVLNNLGVLQLDRNDHSGAAATYEELVQLAGKLGDRVMEAAAHLNLALALLNQDQPGAAAPHLDRVMALETWIRDDPECFAIRAMLAERLHQSARALELMEESRRRSGQAWSQSRQEILEQYRRAAGKPPTS